MRLTSLTIVLPAFNEERIIEKTIVLSKRAASGITSDYEILVVNDGSQDGTAEIIRKLALSDPRIRGIFLPSQMGYGKALSKGFYNAKKEFVFYTDSDAPIDISKELPKAASLVSEEVDAAIGYRINRKDIPLRRIYSIVYNSMSRIFLKIKVRDVNFSCKLFRRRVLEKFKLHSHSVFIDAELLANLNLNGFRIKEFPASYLPRKYGHSNFDSPLYAFKVFVEMLIFCLSKGFMTRKSKK
jgi:glycosyltransferase involved in cell wall biosynthesis